MNKNIYFILYKFKENSGSYAGVFEELSKRASTKGYNVTIICSKDSNKERDFEKLSYANLIRLNVEKSKMPIIASALDFINFSSKVKRYLKKNKVSEEDIIVVNSRAAIKLKDFNYILRMGQPAPVFLKNMNIAKEEISIISRMARYIHFNFLKYLEKICVKNAIALIYPSQETRNFAIQYYNNKDKSCLIWHSGINLKEIQNNKEIYSKGKYLLFISAGGEEKIRKGVIYLEKVLPDIFKEFKDVKLLHVGGQIDWNIPKEFQERIVSVGKVSWRDMPKYYNSSLFIISCSLNEGFPNTLLEAMAAGLPIISSDIQGINEYIKNMEEGIIYKRGDISELKKAIKTLLDNPNLIKSMSNKIKKRAKDFDYDNISNIIFKFFESVSNKEITNTNLLERKN
ncbi:glycosyltransferase family 4 protein [Candidatus Woesearchaeota archaeon]|nr:glycosyltransferase family 4 protein [Candidatus Woesearchaeota archaeon]